MTGTVVSGKRAPGERGLPERCTQPPPRLEAACMSVAMSLSFPNPLSPKRLLPAWEEPFQLWLFSLYFTLTVPVQIRR